MRYHSQFLDSLKLRFHALSDHIHNVAYFLHKGMQAPGILLDFLCD